MSALDDLFTNGGFGPIFIASYETECESCEDSIVPGQRARADGRGGWIHASSQCNSALDISARKPQRKAICRQCFMEHAGECL